ncbi:head-tail joining protein [Ferrovibrio xuzhouensis]|uniref:Uncharacterized protein n=1 Tax=Ferrovibrio xuzhouensis TaxID=1576914 RepID=A0ABV7VC74_9PROT
MAGWRDMVADYYAQAIADFRNVAVAYRPAAGAPFPFEAIFDDAAQITDLGGEVEVSHSNPVLSVSLAGMAVAPAQGDTCTITFLPSAADPNPAPLGDYKVADVLADGRGGAKLPLHKL